MTSIFIKNVDNFVDGGYYSEYCLPLPHDKQNELNRIFLELIGFNTVNEVFLEELFAKFTNVFVSKIQNNYQTKIYTMNSCFTHNESIILGKLFTEIDSNLECASEDFSFARCYNNITVKLFIVVFTICFKYENMVQSDSELFQIFARLNDAIISIDKL